MIVSGKRVLITGGSSGIGFAIARELVANDAHVVISGRREDHVNQAVNALRAGGGHADGAVGDVGSAEGREATLAAAMAALGGLDILVNNAGGVRAGRLEDLTEDEIHAMINVDLLAPILLARASLPWLRAHQAGMIVNVTSGMALIGMPFYATYAAAKAGLAHFGEALRRELKGEGVHVLTVYPAGTDTPMMTTNRGGPDLGFTLEPADAVAAAVVAGILDDSIEVVRGGDDRRKMVALNRSDPDALDRHFVSVKARLAEAVKDHSAL